MSISALSKQQWVSVAKNAVFSGAAAFLIILEANQFNINKVTLMAGGAAALTAIIKFVEKLLTPSA